MLLVLLVVLPLSLMVWLGTYLARDAAKRSEEIRALVQDERFGTQDAGFIDSIRARADAEAQAALLPVFLAVGSGSLLVAGLGWMFFRESTREMREAQQRVTFVNQVSHELKTPLTNIRLYAEMAGQRAEKAADATAVRYLSVVEAETSRLSRLIQNVLSYAMQQRNKLAVSPKPSSLDEVVSATVERWRPLLEGKGIAVTTDLAAPGHARLDPDAIEQILGNLLSNVEKYAAQGKEARISTAAGQSAVKLVVEDRGPGIPPAKADRVFAPFERLRSDLTEGVSGTGIGLTISRELAAAHGGSLEVDPDCRQGARFVLAIPLTPA